jgi:hypothetical protein
MHIFKVKFLKKKDLILLIFKKKKKKIRNRRRCILVTGDVKMQKLINVQKRVTLIMVIYILGFILTWIPYGLVSLYSAFINPGIFVFFHLNFNLASNLVFYFWLPHHLKIDQISKYF